MGENQWVNFEVEPGKEKLVFILDWENEEHDIDLHVYDPRGKHIGYDLRARKS
ncbi:MAG: hypothetical protein QW356_07320 [Candidatus Hadarchaeales archaeon]